MRVTQWGEYGVHCCCHLARQRQVGNITVSAAEIAQIQGIDIQYTQQILQRLRRNEIISSVRGPQGGYQLARPADKITLLEVLTAAEGDSFEVLCETRPLNLERCDAGTHCALRPVWYKLKEHIDSFLRSYTVADLASAEPSLVDDSGPIRIGQPQKVQ